MRALTRLSLGEIIKPPQFNETMRTKLFKHYRSIFTKIFETVPFGLRTFTAIDFSIAYLPDAQNTQKARYVGYFDRSIRSRRRSVLDYVYTTPDRSENGAKKVTKRRSVYTAPERICLKTSLLP